MPRLPDLGSALVTLAPQTPGARTRRWPVRGPTNPRQVRK
jgi:hypothetical protein